MHDLAELIRYLLIFAGAMLALLVLLIVVVSLLPDKNPLRRIFTALSYRVAATLVASAVAVPLEPIPGIDALYDIGAPLALGWFWFTFFRNNFKGGGSRPGNIR